MEKYGLRGPKKGGGVGSNAKPVQPILIRIC